MISSRYRRGNMSGIDKEKATGMALECALLAAKRVGVDLDELMQDARSGVMDSASPYASHVTTPYKTEVLGLIKASIAEVSKTQL